jgi:hypothetical protein
MNKQEYNQYLIEQYKATFSKIENNYSVETKAASMLVAVTLVALSEAYRLGE